MQEPISKANPGDRKEPKATGAKLVAPFFYRLGHRSDGCAHRDALVIISQVNDYDYEVN